MGIESYIRFSLSQKDLLEWAIRDGNRVGGGLCFGICLEYARLNYSRKSCNPRESYSKDSPIQTLMKKPIRLIISLEGGSAPKTRIGERVLLYHHRYQIFDNENLVPLDKRFSIDPVKGVILRKKLSDLFENNKDVLGINLHGGIGHIITIRKFDGSIVDDMNESKGIVSEILRKTSYLRRLEIEKMVENEMTKFRDSSQEFYYVFDPNFGETRPLSESEVIAFLNELLSSKYENKYTQGYFINLNEILVEQLIFRGGERKYNDPSKLQYKAFLGSSASFFASFAAEEAMRICGKKPADFLDDTKAKILLSEQALKVYETGAATIDDFNDLSKDEISYLTCGSFNRLYKFGGVKIRDLLKIDVVKFLEEDLKRFPSSEHFQRVQRMRMFVWRDFLHHDFEIFYKNNCFTVLQLAELEPKMFESVKERYLKKFMFDGKSCSRWVQDHPEYLSLRDDLKEPLSDVIDRIKQKERSL